MDHLQHWHLPETIQNILRIKKHMNALYARLFRINSTLLIEKKKGHHAVLKFQLWFFTSVASELVYLCTCWAIYHLYDSRIYPNGIKLDSLFISTCSHSIYSRIYFFYPLMPPILSLLTLTFLSLSLSLEAQTFSVQHKKGLLYQGASSILWTSLFLLSCQRLTGTQKL